MDKSKIRPNVLIIHNKYQLAGGEDTVAANEGKLLEDHGHKVVYYHRDNNEIKNLSLFRKVGLAFGTVFSLKSYREISALIKENDIDVVHIHNTVPLVSLSAYYAAKRYKCRLVQSIHNMRMLCPTGLMIRNDAVCEECVKHGLHCCVKYGCYRNSRAQSAALSFAIGFHRLIGSYNIVDSYLVTTEFNRSMLERVVKDKNKIVLKPYYSDSATWPVANKKRDYYIYISRLEKLKGIQVALEAFRDMPDKKLLVLGVGPTEEESHRYVKDNGMKNIEFLGFKGKEEMLRLLYDAKALVFPTQWYEGFPMTIVESLAVGTPIIGSDIGNVGTIVRDGENGLTFRYNDPGDLRAKILYLESHREEAEKLECGAQRDFITNHVPERIYNLTMDIYGEKV